MWNSMCIEKNNCIEKFCIWTLICIRKNINLYVCLYLKNDLALYLYLKEKNLAVSVYEKSPLICISFWNNLQMSICICKAPLYVCIYVSVLPNSSQTAGRIWLIFRGMTDIPIVGDLCYISWPSVHKILSETHLFH